MVKSIKQFEVWIVEFDPALGAEIKKSRPAVVVSNNILNDLYATVIVAPLPVHLEIILPVLIPTLKVKAAR